ncbi:family 16 glycosylhydrolase [Deinococcus hopiensis]|uniref:Beta-glucanase/Beta-glucan synthetase n=1 Tax=Deinococcus hopiensis KR-140 TaxID=695939 RepID=A0A1W1UGJ4_9DEIO|nr:family 16 glycosylhydrolase [Deinococcus hopiensis]SMB79894.1 Beta-glucanase/Beta-glucan synthetase [Deinococcus hopiensis KR-140]
MSFPRSLLAVSLVLTLASCGQSSTPGGAPGQVGPETAQGSTLHAQATPVWTQVYSDEFNGTALDTSKWIAVNGAANVNGELEYYTPEDVYLQNGTLVLRTQKRSFGGRGYSSGEVRSGNNVTVTRGSAVEWRTKVPKGKGIWPANWLVSTGCDGINGCGSAWPPEIDVMELRGSQPTINNMTHWWGTYPNQNYQTTQYAGPDFSQDFHTYRVEWLADRITFYIDGVQRAQHTANITTGTMQLVMNTAVGGMFDGNPDASTTFPQYQLVDYVRVYRDTSGSTGGTNLVTNGTFDGGLSGWGVWSPNNAYQSTVFTETYNGRNGAHATEYSASPYEVHTYQVKTGLATGNYTLRAWVRSTGGQSVGEMLVKNFGGTQRSLDIRGYTNWTQVSIPNVYVTNGQAEIGFHTTAGAYQYLYFDDVEFFKQ